MQFRQFRMGRAGPGAGIGCGGILAVFGLILVSPVGEWLIKGIGWILIFMGVLVVVTGIYYWIRGPRRGRFL
ncbi:MAG: hypothetical protein IH872_10925 [Chloroflexi bacterium]|nr:hypothetical protein [Chloroflexota bacterium]